MNFQTEALRQAHPIAKLIPAAVWRLVFDSELTPFQEQLFSASFQDLPVYLQQVNPYIKREGEAAWFCIALNHHQFPAATLRDIAIHHLAISPHLLFIFASRLSRLDLLKDLVEHMPDKVQAMLAFNQYCAFIAAAGNGRIDILQYFLSLAPQQGQAMVEAQDYAAFRLAAKHQHFVVMLYVAGKAVHQLQAMIAAKNYVAFAYAAAKGDLQILTYLIENVRSRPSNWAVLRFVKGYLSPWLADTFQLMIEANQFMAFRLAVQNGHLEVLHFLEQVAPLKLQQMIDVDNFIAFKWAAAYGHQAILAYLCQKSPDKIQAMLEASKHEAFQLAAQNGHIHILKYLAMLLPSKFQEMIEADDYGAFQAAAEYGQIEVLRYLVSSSPHRLQEMLAANDYQAFQIAAEHGHIEVLRYLAKLAPDRLQAMICAQDYAAFQGAAFNGYLNVLHYLLDKGGSVRQAMMMANEFEAFQFAAEGGQQEVLLYLARALPDRLQEMIENTDYYAFRIAAERSRTETINWFFSQSIRCFAYAEAHNYAPFVSYFIDIRLKALRAQKDEFSRQFLRDDFDVQDSLTAQYCFYMLRNLIRQARPNGALSASIRDNLLFLLSLPSVRALAHTSMNQATSNELLRLALSSAHADVTQILLNIPAVRVLAEQNNFYRQEEGLGMGASQLARSRESSMVALTSAEQLQLTAVTTHYQARLQQVGLDNLMNGLRQWLLTRYQAQPAILQIQGRAIPLPYDWQALMRLDFNLQQQQDALKAYFQHPDHSAWRYLLKPNPWVNMRAQHVEVNPSNTQQRWSSFTNYQPLIVILWLAALDDTVAATAGHTIEGRIEHFVRSLALIGRAHNWDNVRHRFDGRVEEYDDLTGDKPSCYSGVKRRLFQSVLGHPLLKTLTKDDINQEIREFVRAHFAACITIANANLIKRALDQHFIMLDAPDPILFSLNISSAKSEAFIQHLCHKYGALFRDDPNLTKQATTLLALKAQGEPIECLHGLKFASMVNLMQMLEQLVATAGASSGSSRELRFFQRERAREQAQAVQLYGQMPSA